jgi:hypothetical protein
MDTPIIYITDVTYDRGNDYAGLTEEQASEEYRKQLEILLGVELRKANIGQGADWPVFAYELVDLIKNNSSIAIALGIFFSGKRIKENLDAWINIGDCALSQMMRFRPLLNRSAALLMGLAHYVRKEKNQPFEIEIIEYRKLDSRCFPDLEQISIEPANVIENQPTEEEVGYTIHYYRMFVDGKIIVILNRADVFIVKKEE